MKIAVISDLHLGTLDSTDQFIHYDFEFIKFLSFLEDNFERIILLGDIYEGLMSIKFRNIKEKILKCMDSHKGIVKKFENIKYKYIAGNHDEQLKYIVRADDKIEIKINNKSILFIHGHQFDPFIQNYKFLSELGVWSGGWILRYKMNKIYKLIEKNVGICSNFNKLAIKRANKTNVDIVVTGHTHNITKCHYDNTLFLNSGSCSKGEFNFISMDTNKDEYNINTTW